MRIPLIVALVGRAGGTTNTGRQRRSQVERTAATRAALLDATVECLIEVGYSRTTTTEVTRRAGVSQGALLHHFPVKADLLVAAVEHLCQQRTDAYRKAMANLDPALDRLDVSIDLLWESMSDSAFVAWTELWVAARSDPELRKAVVAMNQRFVANAKGIYEELFPPDVVTAEAEFFEIGMQLTFALMDGMALSRLHPPYSPYPAEHLLGALKEISRIVYPR